MLIGAITVGQAGTPIRTFMTSCPTRAVVVFNMVLHDRLVRENSEVSSMTLLFRLRAEDLDGGRVCCLGSQLVRIVALLDDFLDCANWYVADLDFIGRSKLPKGSAPALVGPTADFLNLVGTIDQFLRGVFLAVDAANAKPRFRDPVDTEDSEDADLGDARLEIRAFDATFFEILTQDRQLGAALARAFGVSPVSESQIPTP